MKEEDFKIIERKLPEAEKLFGVLPGEALLPFDFKTFEILASKENESDLRLIMQSFLRLQSEAEGVSADLLCSCYLSFLQLSVLIRQRRQTFDKSTIIALSDEYKARRMQLEEVRVLTSKQFMTCESFEKDKLALTVFKFEMLLKAIDRELAGLNVRGVSRTREQQDEKIPDEILTKEKVPRKKREKKLFLISKPAIFVRKKEVPVADHNEKNVSDTADTKPEQDQQPVSSEAIYPSKTNLMEVPVKEKRVRYEKELDCHMLPGFLILMARGSFYFGRKSSAKGKIYVNETKTLYELTQINVDTLQFLTQDLLSGEFQIKRFSQDEKYAMEDYFSFMT